jgi:hypothetical protein
MTFKKGDILIGLGKGEDVEDYAYPCKDSRVEVVEVDMDGNINVKVLSSPLSFTKTGRWFVKSKHFKKEEKKTRTRTLLTPEQARYLEDWLLPNRDNQLLANFLNAKFDLNLTATQVKDWKKKHKKKEYLIPVFKITKKIRGWRHGY